jgi:hypothetical protein
LDAVPAQSFCELNVKVEPETPNGAVSISQMLPTNTSASWAKAGAAAMTAKNAIAAELMILIVTAP